MALILAGVDEAGYGPLLGPLTVGLSVWRVEGWADGEPAPNLWTLLKSGVCRKASDRRSRVAIDDSKKLKLANRWEAGGEACPDHVNGEAGGDGCPTKVSAGGDGHVAMYDPHASLAHLARGVLAVLAALDARPVSDDELLGALGVWTPGAEEDPASAPGLRAYSRALGVCASAELLSEVGIAANMVRRACALGGVCPLALSCRAVYEPEFNAVVASTGSKGTLTGSALIEHARSVWMRWGDDPDAGEHGPRLVADRHGGRTDYAEMLSRIAPGAVVRTLEHSERQSRYLVSVGAAEAADGRARRLSVVFEPEADGSHLPVALASMTAKLVRELLMARFNRAFCAAARARNVELKPTAGYRTDAHRWLADATRLGVLTQELRAALVRLT